MVRKIGINLDGHRLMCYENHVVLTKPHRNALNNCEYK
jgi:hypothetical protein